MINTSSIKTAPKGKSPPKAQQKYLFRYQGWGGTNLGIGYDLHGFLIVCFLYPMKPPRKTKGNEIPNHKAIRMVIVSNET